MIATTTYSCFCFENKTDSILLDRFPNLCASIVWDGDFLDSSSEMTQNNMIQEQYPSRTLSRVQVFGKEDKRNL